MKRLAAFLPPCLALALVVTGCTPDKPKADPDAPKKTTPVPSDMAFNDFLPPGAEAKKISVKIGDGGLEAGALAGGESGDPAAPAGEGNGFKVTEAGSEPRSARKFSFATGKTERRSLTLEQTITAGGKQQKQPAFTFVADITVKEAKAAGFLFEMKVVRAELADKEKADPRMVQAAAKELGAFNGLAATFEVSPKGDVGELSMSGNPKMQKEGAAQVLEILGHFAELILPIFPTEPIGTGAKWEKDELVRSQGMEVKQHRVVELKDVTAEGGTIVSTITRKVPKRPMNDPRMPPGALVSADEKGSYTYTFRFDRVSTKVEGELAQDVQLEMGGGQGKETMKQVAKHVIDVAK